MCPPEPPTPPKIRLPKRDFLTLKIPTRLRVEAALAGGGRMVCYGMNETNRSMRYMSVRYLLHCTCGALSNSLFNFVANDF